MKNIIYSYECFCGQKVTYFSLKAFFLKYFCDQRDDDIERNMYIIIKFSWPTILKSTYKYWKEWRKPKGKGRSDLDYWHVLKLYFKEELLEAWRWEGNQYE